MMDGPVQLDLSEEGYATVPESIPIDVYSISLASNRIHALHGLGRLVHLRQVDLSCNKLTHLAGIESLQLLSTLNLARNNLSSLAGLDQMNSLQYINVSDNNLTDLDGLMSHTGLVYVNASINHLASWPNLCHLGSLETLNLNDNQLSVTRTLPTSLPTSLRQLKLAYNQIDHLGCFDACAGKYHHLHSLDLAGNRCVLHNPSAAAFLADIFPALRLLDGLPRATDPTPTTEEADVSDRNVKLQLWKQMLQDRRDQDDRDRMRLRADISHNESPVPVPTPRPLAPADPTPRPILFAEPSPPSEVTRAASLPKYLYENEALGDEPPLVQTSVFLTPCDDEPLSKQVQTLHDHVRMLRKYAKVWIKREQRLRDKSAVCIQKYYRGYRSRRQHPRRCQTRRDPSCRVGVTVQPVSSFDIVWRRIAPEKRIFHAYAQVVQRMLRGWIIRRRFGLRRVQHRAAISLQKCWRGFRARTIGMWQHVGRRGVLRTLFATTRHVTALQRQLYIQDEAMATLWRTVHVTQHQLEGLRHRAAHKGIRLFQARWRGYAVRRATQLPRPHVNGAVRCTGCASNTVEIEHLRDQVDRLQRLVQQLLAQEARPERSEDGDGAHPIAGYDNALALSCWGELLSLRRS
ncbi:hypothetical protein SDRG_13548 [Saprolegnia diclina VS20]|uniref:Uncharacterized protein n=1 Tax=Saprolegnia diclina (strain VS20) TaxID=1156394 RepID=T0Q279_SAPDV|nr:hypothetical protein SDRG_13548 [Saprolegnia diclina VS20]EQC28671.1 hypothetical protein SDRG_13548 [Saprolegnia diclina VS20]|eukprot:XP_008617863.1 hypothetical protein SDRG_13548 [Saprolegnia diclina VS20]